MKTGFEFLDLLINGYARQVHCFYGKAGTGKTTILLKAAAEFSKQGKVFYINPFMEFNISRIMQISDPKLENLFLIKNFNQTLFKAILGHKNTVCLIIDPVTAFWDKDLPSFVSFMAQVKDLTRNIPVILSAEVYTDIDTDTLKMKCHGVIVQFCTVIVELEKRRASTGGWLNVAICRKHPSERLEGKEADFELGGNVS